MADERVANRGSRWDDSRLPGNCYPRRVPPDISAMGDSQRWVFHVGKIQERNTYMDLNSLHLIIRSYTLSLSSTSSFLV